MDVSASPTTEAYTDADYFAEAGGFFRTLASLLFRELSQEEIDALAETDFLAMRDEMEPGLLADGFAGLGRYLRRRSVNVRQDLAVDYARVFLGAGVGEGKLAVPFESVFTSEDGLLMQDARDQVVRTYRTWGVHVDASLNVPEDHLSFELQFLGDLSERTAAAIEGGRSADSLLQAQVEFLDSHVLNWVDALREKVEACANGSFYPSVMKIVCGYAAEHRAACEEALAA